MAFLVYYWFWACGSWEILGGFPSSLKFEYPWNKILINNQMNGLYERLFWFCKLRAWKKSYVWKWFWICTYYWIYLQLLSLHKKCLYSEFFWSVFSRIRTEYVEILLMSPYSVRMRENTDHKISEYGHFSRSAYSYNFTTFVTSIRDVFRTLSNL